MRHSTSCIISLANLILNINGIRSPVWSVCVLSMAEYSSTSPHNQIIIRGLDVLCAYMDILRWTSICLPTSRYISHSSMTGNSLSIVSSSSLSGRVIFLLCPYKSVLLCIPWISLWHHYHHWTSELCSLIIQTCNCYCLLHHAITPE